jgi:hypothetical protein
MMLATSPFDRPQNEQLNLRALIFAIIGILQPVGLLAVSNYFVY